VRSVASDSVPDLRQLLQVNPLASARHGGKLLVYRKTTVRIHRGAQVDIDERLTLGRQWAGGAPLYRGHFVVRDGARLEIGKVGLMTGLRVGVAEGAELIWRGGGSNSDLRLSCYESIRIGENVGFGDRVTLRDSDNHDIGSGKPMGAPIVIEDNVWVGLESTILKGVTIGTGAMVAAGSLVTKDVPPGTLVAGRPAKVIRQDIAWSW
jgi:acetyltransferase-like isoleucine patch superfamily enzyme